MEDLNNLLLRLKNAPTFEQSEIDALVVAIEFIRHNAAVDPGIESALRRKVVPGLNSLLNKITGGQG